MERRSAQQEVSWFALAAIGIALPAITYLFLSSLWLLRLAQRLLPGVR